jgi:hypothetical protein
MEFFPQENCAQLSNTESVILLSRQQVRLVLKIPYLDPFRVRNFRCAWQASDGDFVLNLGGDVKAPKKSIEKVKAPELVRITSGDESATTITLRYGQSTGAPRSDLQSYIAAAGHHAWRRNP